MDADRPGDQPLVREGIPFIVNPYDAHALEEPLRLKELAAR
nr:hypothetical protein [Geomonas subterranea]